jgi:hypothetical protein
MRTTMAASNAERQAKWRKRQKRRIAELEAKIAKLERARPGRRSKTSPLGDPIRPDRTLAGVSNRGRRP